MAKRSGTGKRASKDSTPAAPPQRKILIVEDDDDMRALIRRWLESDGHVVEEAASGPAGLRGALDGTHDVAFIDIVLPVMDGYEIARQVRAAAKNMCLVAMTATTDDPSVAFEAGFDAHLFKPVAETSIKAVLAEVGRRKGQVR